MQVCLFIHPGWFVSQTPGPQECDLLAINLITRSLVTQLHTGDPAVLMVDGSVSCWENDGKPDESLDLEGGWCWCFCLLLLLRVVLQVLCFSMFTFTPFVPATVHATTSRSLLTPNWSDGFEFDEHASGWKRNLSATWRIIPASKWLITMA